MYKHSHGVGGYNGKNRKKKIFKGMLGFGEKKTRDE